ncbi:MAG TPA: aminotransferase class III-fold pyridoxal phosphate-dependent enzyme [Anaerolineae bacterium]|jgi:glutamate-1-semialdehyde 2,1-aminomutase|nr:aminotransferase class III-fold pyridoxal phosphate-dependent enzyme [Anaerolineae bacterium]
MAAPATASTSDREHLLGGISSAFRVNPYTGGHLQVADAHGAHIRTTDGQSYIDMFMAHGSTVLGHAHPAVIAAVREVLEAGVIIGYEVELGEQVARQIGNVVPSAEAVRFVASGSEAVTTALRIARAVTGRDLVVKIDGHYNGASDYALVNSLAANTDAENMGGSMSRRIPSSAGIPASILESILPIPWNDLDALDAVLSTYGDQVAAVIMVPIDFNNGCITPADGYLAAALERAHAAGALLIFDEVLSGLKVPGGSAQAMYGVTPDLTTVSKAMSSGVPLAAVVGRREPMEALLRPGPQKPIQGGTYAGSALGLAAASATLGLIEQGTLHADLLERAGGFFERLQAVFDRSPLPGRVQSVGCMFTVYVGTRDPVRDYRDMRALDPELARRFFVRCIEEGLYFHTDFSVSAAHSQEILDEVLERMEGIANEPGW